jgi:glycosyltransferase involved in cell wall biosynthesis
LPFNKSLALNVGAHHAHGETLFFLDADLELHEGSCSAGLRLVSDDCAVTLDRVVESAAKQGRVYEHLHSIVNSIELETDEGRVVRLETNRRHLHDGSRSAPGMVFVRKSRFEQVGGMNSDLTGWGWEDLDLLARLQLAAGMRIERAGTATHLTHADEARSISGPHRAANESHNAAMCMANYGLGYYLGTYADDVATHCESSSAPASEA